MNTKIHLPQKKSRLSGEITLGGSKSESNRVLILNALYQFPIQIHNLSDSEDTQVLEKALMSDSSTIDINHAGTAMRFLTAYFSIQEGRSVTLTGSHRMKERPIGILVEALKSLGANIEYLEKEGFPPLKIQGKAISKGYVQLNSGTSSQFISALCLIAPKLPHGLTLELVGKITSLPYLLMSLEILQSLGIRVERTGNIFKIHPKSKLETQEFWVESDWSSASYFYSIATLAHEAHLKLNYFRPESLQGDAVVREIYQTYFGVESRFEDHQLILTKKSTELPKRIELDLNSSPDIAQTIAVTCAGLKIPCLLKGLETLKIKETDRISALENELKKLKVQTWATDHSLELVSFGEVDTVPCIQTYHDHRMALSFAPLSLKFPIEIENPEVVRKSYPNFWKDFELLK